MLFYLGSVLILSFYKPRICMIIFAINCFTVIDFLLYKNDLFTGGSAPAEFHGSADHAAVCCGYLPVSRVS